MKKRQREIDMRKIGFLLILLSLSGILILGCSDSNFQVQVGETVDISMVFDNVGTLPITGTAVIEVQTAEGFTFAGPFTDTVEGLAPGSSVELQRAWDTTGVALGDYRVIGYVLYDARSTGASTVALTNLRRVYLPVVLRDF